MSNPILTSPIPDEGRYNFYHDIHKALRLGHCRMLAAIGAADFEDEPTTRILLDELKILINLGKSHIECENREIHTALEARLPGAAAHATDEHGRHERSFAEIESLIRAVEVAIPERRAVAGRALYRRYALVAAIDIEHMYEEETALLQSLHMAFTDDELRMMEGRIVSNIPHAKLVAYAKLMVPALNPAERADRLDKLKKSVPEQVFTELLEIAAKLSLTAEDYANFAGQPVTH